MVLLASIGVFQRRILDYLLLSRLPGAAPIKEDGQQTPTVLWVIYHVIRVLVNVGVSALMTCFIPALVFHHIEDWTYLEALYYSFVTVTTIGFGDYVAGRNA